MGKFVDGGARGARGKIGARGGPDSARAGGELAPTSRVISAHCQMVQLFASHLVAATIYHGMEGKPSPAACDRGSACGDPDPVLSFVETGRVEQRPRLLVERLLYARGLLQANAVLAPRFLLGDCAAAHHIVLGGAMTGQIAVERLMTFGFRVAPSIDPPGIRFTVSSSHSEAEIRALLVAITIVVRELK